MITIEEKEKILAAADIICLSCVEDTLNNEEICEIVQSVSCVNR